MVFTPKPKLNSPSFSIKFGTQEIDKVTQCKFLGVTVDHKLDWDIHIAGLTKKVAKSIGIMNRIKKFLNKAALKTMYFAFIYPLLLYCNCIWGNASKQILWPLHKLQKVAIRLIGMVGRRESTGPILKENKILSLPDLYSYSTLIFMHKYYHKQLPKLFDGYFVTNKETHGRSTRFNQKFRIPLVKTMRANNAISKKGAVLWNELDPAIRVNLSIKIFKKDLISFIIKKY